VRSAELQNFNLAQRRQFLPSCAEPNDAVRHRKLGEPRKVTRRVFADQQRRRAPPRHLIREIVDEWTLRTGWLHEFADCSKAIDRDKTWRGLFDSGHNLR